jgi:hypothetical protein
VIIDVDVVTGETTHDTQGFAKLLKFVQQWSVRQKVVYRLTMPQHYFTHQSTSTYKDGGHVWQPQRIATGQMH